ncbi:hypothetical protein VV208B2_45750 (plasmid) [Vibrio vulnificus]|nr:hypothetical protein VV208B2_45750 [Vibrio vulnificus]BDP38264.1 hypothetical protein VA208B3_46350 [Vibrio alginolyticus]
MGDFGKSAYLSIPFNRLGAILIFKKLTIYSYKACSNYKQQQSGKVNINGQSNRKMYYFSVRI